MLQDIIDEQVTHFAYEMDEDGFLACEVFNGKQNVIPAKPMRFVAPVVYIENLPIQLNYILQRPERGDRLVISSPLGSQHCWFFNLLVEIEIDADYIEKHVRLVASFMPPVTIETPNNIKSGPLHLSFKFRFKPVNICRPFENVIPGVLTTRVNAFLRVESIIIPVNKLLLARRSKYFHNLFRESLDNQVFELDTLFEPTEQFVKLACFHTDFAFDGERIEELMNLCVKFEADNCLTECGQFLLLTEKISRPDSVLLLQNFPQLADISTLLTRLISAERKIYRAEMWKTDFRLFSQDTLKQMTYSCDDINETHTSEFLRADIVKNRHSQLVHNLTFNNLVHPIISVVISHTLQNNICLTKLEVRKCFWFMYATIVRTIKKRGIVRTYRHKFIATRDSGYSTRQLQKKIDMAETEYIKIEFTIHHFWYTMSSMGDTSFKKRDEFTNLILHTKEANGTPVTFYVSRELLEQCCDYFNTPVFSGANEITLEVPKDGVLGLLIFAYSPLFVINSVNFAKLLHATLFFGIKAQLPRLEKYYRGCTMSAELKNQIDTEYPNIFEPNARPYYSMEYCPSNEQKNEWAAEFGECPCDTDEWLED